MVLALAALAAAADVAAVASKAPFALCPKPEVAKRGGGGGGGERSGGRGGRGELGGIRRETEGDGRLEKGKRGALTGVVEK